VIGAITAGLFGTGVAASTNSYESIATVTVGAGGQSTISFTSIPSTYKHLQLRGILNDTGGGGYNAFVQLNSDTGANYAWHYLQGNGATAGAGAATSTTSFIIGKTGYTNGNGATVVDILDYQNTNKYKTARSLNGIDFNNSSGVLFYSSGLWQNTAAITTISVTNSSGTFGQYSQFALIPR
jgi:hypothetical protein